MRMQNRYNITHEGKHLVSDRVLEFDVTKFLPLALNQGELTTSDILDIAHIEPDEKPTEPSIVSELNANLLAGGVE